MRKFYEAYPIWSAVPTELSWSHFQELIRVDRKEERSFYENETIKSNWGYRELGRQINTKLYDRYLISPDKNKILLEVVVKKTLLGEEIYSEMENIIKEEVYLNYNYKIDNLNNEKL